MLKFLIIGGVLVYIYRLFGRDSSIAKKSTPFNIRQRPAERHEVIEDIEYTEKES